jgi:hypothetical protein
MGIAWLKLGILKLREVRREYEKGKLFPVFGRVLSMYC